MDQAIVDVARGIAADLTDLDAGLPAKIEAEILADDQPPAERHFDAGITVGIAGLVLAVAQFAYQIHRDRIQDQKTTPNAFKRRLRVELDERGYPDTTDRARVIEAAVQIMQV